MPQGESIGRRGEGGPAASAPSPRSRGGHQAWQDLPARIDARGHYLDEFLGALKRDAYLRLIERWADCTGRRVLKTDLFEEGMGPDAFMDRLAEVAALAVGFDLSVAVARRARRRFAGARLLCVAADVRHLPFRPGSFDRILSPSTLDHFAEHGDLHVSLIELHRALRPDGRMVITLDNRQNVFDPLLRLAARLRLVPYFLGRSYSERELRTALAAAAYEVFDTTAIVHNPRLVAAGAVALARRIGWPLVTRGVRRMLLGMQRFDGTRWRFRTGCFVAALAGPAGPEATSRP